MQESGALHTILTVCTVYNRNTKGRPGLSQAGPGIDVPELSGFGIACAAESL